MLGDKKKGENSTSCSERDRFVTVWKKKFGAFSLLILEAERSVLASPPSRLLVRDFHQDEDGDPVRAGPGESCQPLAGARGLLVASAPQGSAQGPGPGEIRGSRRRAACAAANAGEKRSRIRMFPFRLRCIYNGTY